MSMNPGFAERLAFGRPLTAEVDPVVHSEPRPTTALVGRFLLAAIFVISGVAKLTDPAGSAGYMASVGLPESQGLAMIAGAGEVLGGVMIALGFLSRLGGLGLLLYLIPTTLLFHAFWNYDGAERLTQMVTFLKNLAIMGGLALLVAHGPGRYSIDASFRRPQEP